VNIKWQVLKPHEDVNIAKFIFKKKGL
jgi:hypothetical protein